MNISLKSRQFSSSTLMDGESVLANQSFGGLDDDALKAEIESLQENVSKVWDVEIFLNWVHGHQSVIYSTHAFPGGDEEHGPCTHTSGCPIEGITTGWGCAFGPRWRGDSKCFWVAEGC